jgi:tetratricopeptide (TPR) repeat protein
MSIRTLVLGCLTIILTSAPLAAQPLNARERAREPYASGLEYMRTERFDEAARAFESAVRIDPEFEMAHYMLGRVHLVQRNYMPAVYALVQARDLYRAQASRRSENKAEGQRIRRELINDMNNVISQLRLAPQTPQVQEQIRQYTERKRQVEDMDREDGLTADKVVPGFVSLSLGSAYFRAGKMADAEQAYLTAIGADPKIGEAHNNLAVVYFETGRYKEAERAVRAAEKAGVRVHPDLKASIAAKVKSS